MSASTILLLGGAFLLVASALADWLVWWKLRDWCGYGAAVLTALAILAHILQPT